MNKPMEEIITNICDQDVRYREDAYEFLMESLSYTQKKFKRTQHVTGQELLIGIKELLMEKFGPMTLTVLKHWGINSTEDFGHIVFNLVENRILSKTDEDNIEHFKNVYDFEEVFNKGYHRHLAKKISRMRSG